MPWEGPDLEDSGTLLRNYRLAKEMGSPQVGELEGRGQGCGRELTSRQAPDERTPCDPGGVTGMRQLRGGQRLGHGAGVHRARWVAAQDDPVGCFGGGDTRGKSDGEN